MAGWGAIYNNTRMALHMHAQTLARLQEQAASGARINRASDAPSDAFRLLKLRAQSADLEEYSQNLDDVSGTLELGHTLLQQITDGLNTAIQKLQQAVSGTYSQNQRTIIGEELDALLQQFVSLANTESMGRYIFSGASTDTAPYVVEMDGSYVGAVRYRGSRETLPVPVAPGVQMAGLLVGDRLFRGDDRHEPGFLGSTGAAAGSATSNIRGNAYLRVAHKEMAVTADADGVNLQPTSDAGYADTALGEFDLIVDMTAKTVRFAGAAPKSFAGTETHLEVRNADGDVVYLDVSGLNAALVGEHTVTFRSGAQLSIGDGAAVDVTDFSGQNVAVTDADGRVLYVDVTGLRRTGVEAIRVPGTFDLFQTFIEARDALLNRQELPAAEQQDRLRDAIEAVNEVLGNVTQATTSLGGRLEALDTLRGSLEDIRAIADDQAGNLENADLVQIATDLARTQTLYQMTLATASKLLTLSLLDYI